MENRQTEFLNEFNTPCYYQHLKVKEPKIMSRLVQLTDKVSGDSVEALEFLLAKAKNGEVVGLAYIAQLKRKRFLVDTAGDANLNPVQFIGMASLLTNDLIQRAKGEL